MVQASRQVHLTFSRLSARPGFAAAENVDFIAAKKVKDPHYLLSIHRAGSSLQPMARTSRFHKILRWRRILYFSPARMLLYSFEPCTECRQSPGDFAECGIWKGGTALLLARVLNDRTGKTLYLFDSFEGSI